MIPINKLYQYPTLERITQENGTRHYVCDKGFYHAKRSDAYRFYVYELLDPRTELPFYVGKGQGPRASSHIRAIQQGRNTDNPYKDNVIRQILSEGLVPKIKIGLYGLSSDEAYELESQVTKFYGLRIESEYGILTNLCHGGKGGQLWTTERKIQQAVLMSGNKINQGRKMGASEKQFRSKNLQESYEVGTRVPTIAQLQALDQTGKKRSAETKNKISNNAKNRSPEHRRKIADKLKGKIPWNKGLTGCYTQTDESNQKRSKTLTGRAPTRGCKGHKMSPESIQKRIESRRKSAEERGKW